MAGEAEPGHVGGGPDTVAERGLGGLTVQGGHGARGGGDGRFRGPPGLERGRDHPRAERLGEDHHVPGPAPRVGEDPLRVHEAGDRVAELDLGVAHRVSAEEHAAGLPELGRPAPHDGSRPLQGEVALGEGRDGERGQGSAPHRVDVGEGVGGGDRPEGLGIVHHRGEEIHRLHEGGPRVETEHPGVVPGRVVHQDPRVVVRRQSAQDLGELGGPELARSTRAGHALGQPADPLPLVGHLPVPSVSASRSYI